MRMHRGDKLSCSICNKKYTQKKSLSRHWQAAHSEEEQTYNCDVCSKAFKLQENLKRHMKMHGEKKHKCEVSFVWDWQREIKSIKALSNKKHI